jgi:hypothetical protein
LAGGDRRFGDVVDVRKLRVAVRVRGALSGLHVGLQAVAEQPEQLRDCRVVDLVTALTQPGGEMTDAL